MTSSQTATHAPHESEATTTSSNERPLKSNCVHDELLPDGTMILFHSCKQELMTLNPTAAIVWEYCDGLHSPDAIAAEIHEVFPDAANVEDEVLTLLQQLIEQSYITDENL